ncbi:hypothetical protein F383_34142 [Gossypium arboreum]|uniref:Uncharacterized protein n=1 Tax=Gossypium arboreum TaxID=29729 RepID=A0A0B0N941_GOSAR|nr:hypothetical protein F383_34142 [Gossypium arboreum]
MCFIILNFMTVICRFHKTWMKVKPDRDSNTLLELKLQIMGGFDIFFLTNK